jgi:hypothetical protein
LRIYEIEQTKKSILETSGLSYGARMTGHDLTNVAWGWAEGGGGGGGQGVLISKLKKGGKEKGFMGGGGGKKNKKKRNGKKKTVNQI